MAEAYEVKGTAILSIIEFVRATWGPDGLERWRTALSPAARALTTTAVAASSWFPGPLATEMRQAIIDQFYGGDRARIRALGYFSGERGLTGVYKLAIKVGSPMWVVDRLSMVYTSYFRPGRVVLSRREPGDVVGALEGFPDRSGIMEEVFAGFVQKALELSGARDIVVGVVKGTATGGYEFQGRWK